MVLCALACLTPAQGSATAAPSLRVEAESPVIADWPLRVTTSWTTDVPRRIAVVLVRSQACAPNLALTFAEDPDAVSVLDDMALASGTRTDEVTIVRPGSFLVCGFLQTSSSSDVPADAAFQGPERVEITTFAQETRRCGHMHRPQAITHIRARNATCRNARWLVRRWAEARPVDGGVSDYRCRLRDEQVTCRASAGRRVTFRLG